MWNDLVDAYLDGSGYAFIPYYCFSYWTTICVQLTVDNMLYAGLGVFCVLLLLLDLRVTLFIMLMVAMIDVHLFSWICLWGISLDNVSYTECVMAVGLTVDYVIHITHAICDAHPTVG